MNDDIVVDVSEAKTYTSYETFSEDVTRYTLTRGGKGLLEDIVKAISDLISSVLKPILNTIESTVRTISDYVVNFIKPYLESVYNFLVDVYVYVTDYLYNTLTSIHNLVRTLYQYLSNVKFTIEATISNAWAGIVDSVTNVYNTVVSAKDTIMNSVSEFATNVYSKFNAISTTLGSMWTNFTNHLATLGNNLLSGITNLVHGFTNAFNSFTNSITQALRNLGLWIADGMKSVGEAMFAEVRSLYNTIVEMGKQSLSTSPHFFSLAVGKTYYEKAINLYNHLLIMYHTGSIVTTIHDAINPASQRSAFEYWREGWQMAGMRYTMQRIAEEIINYELLIPLRYELNNIYRHEPIPYSDAMAMRSRFIISDTDFEHFISLQGIDPNKELKKPTKWYAEEDLLAYPTEPDRWREVEIRTWGDAYRRLAGEPAGYFLLSMAARNGYFDETVYRRALLDSNYGPLAMGIAMQAFRRAFLRRWLTKFEDYAIERYLDGEITLEEFKDELRDLGYSEDIVNIFAEFFSERRKRYRKKATLTMLKKALQSGRITEEEFKKGLAELGYDPKSWDMILEQTWEEIAPDRELTASQILNAYKKGIIDYDYAYMRLSRIYAYEDDVKILLELYKPTG